MLCMWKESLNIVISYFIVLGFLDYLVNVKDVINKFVYNAVKIELKYIKSYTQLYAIPNEMV